MKGSASSVIWLIKGSSEICKSCPVQKSFKDRKVHISEEDVQLSNGKTAQVVVYSAPILDVSGNVAAVIEMSTNITQVKEIQKELAFLGQSLAILSHDIKNILEGLQGGAYVVDEGIKDGDMALAGKGWDIVKRNIGEISTYRSKHPVFFQKKGSQIPKGIPRGDGKRCGGIIS